MLPGMVASAPVEPAGPVAAAPPVKPMDFIHHTAVRNDGINQISRAALAKAGAIATPTLPDE
jgi:hypothetical protein